jgi:Leucine-rich repeat (LRR) protein
MVCPVLVLCADVFAPLVGLKRFCCSNNALTSECIPWNTLVCLPRLSHLIMDSNQLTALPVDLGQVSTLRVLNVSANLLTTLPENLDSLGSLEELNVSRNQLESIPQRLGVNASCSM